MRVLCGANEGWSKVVRDITVRFTIHWQSLTPLKRASNENSVLQKL